MAWGKKLVKFSTNLRKSEWKDNDTQTMWDLEGFAHINTNILHLKQQDAAQLLRFTFPRMGEIRNGKSIQFEDADETRFVHDNAFGDGFLCALAFDRSLTE